MFCVAIIVTIVFFFFINTYDIIFLALVVLHAYYVMYNTIN